MHPITYTAYLMGRSRIEDLPLEHVQNMTTLLNVVNGLLLDLRIVRKVNSGYRRLEDNRACGGSPNSNHLKAAAIDLEDKDGSLKKIMTEDMLDKYGLYMEHPSKCPGWCHLSILPPKSGQHIFMP